MRHTGDTAYSRREGRAVERDSDAPVVRPGVLPTGYVPVHATPGLCVHSEHGILLASDDQAITAEMKAHTASFQTIALEQSFAPASLVDSFTDLDLLNEHDDGVITVLVMPVRSVPASTVELLRVQPIAGPIPAWIADDAVAYRSVKQIQHGFVVSVSGRFTKAAIARFTNALDFDVDRVNLLLKVDDDGWKSWAP